MPIKNAFNRKDNGLSKHKNSNKNRGEVRKIPLPTSSGLIKGNFLVKESGFSN
jgi:hypothetical protein